jgi:hypothetical protein
LIKQKEQEDKRNEAYFQFGAAKPISSKLQKST